MWQRKAMLDNISNHAIEHQAVASSRTESRIAALHHCMLALATHS
jgi:hypothetical protein